MVLVKEEAVTHNLEMLVKVSYISYMKKKYPFGS